MSCQHFPLSRQPSQSKGQNLVVTALCVPCSLARVRASPAFKDCFESLPVSYAQGTRSSYPQSPAHKPRCLVNCAHGSLVCQSSALRLKALDPLASESTTIERLTHLIAAHAPLSSLGQHVPPDPPPPSVVSSALRTNNVSVNRRAGRERSPCRPSSQPVLRAHNLYGLHHPSPAVRFRTDFPASCRANVAHIRLAGPVSGLGLHTKVLDIFSSFPLVSYLT